MPKSRIAREVDEILRSGPHRGLSGESSQSDRVLRSKLEAMKKGEIVVTNDEEMDQMLALDDDEIVKVRSLPNPQRVGIKDRYIAWIGSPKPPSVPKIRHESHATIAKFDPSQLRVGQRFDHFGHTYEILKIGRDRNRTIQIARPHMDRFGKVDFIDHRSFPARSFDQQHLSPIAD